MTGMGRDLFERILRLPPVERAELVEEIHRSLGSVEDDATTRAWVNEADERIDACDRGRLAGRDYEQVKKSLQEQ